MTEKLYPNLKGTDRVREDCGKCSGTGSVSWGVNLDGAVIDASGHRRIVPKVCFDCDGLGFRRVLVSSLRATARRQARAAAEAARREAEQRVRFAELAIQQAEQENREREAEEARRAAATPVPAGRVEVTGEIVGRKFVDGYAYGSSVLKIVVLDDRGFKVYGSCPAALSGERGSRVTFTAALEASRDDELFGFFKRPTKAREL